jgi:hypothetical protein
MVAGQPILPLLLLPSTMVLSWHITTVLGEAMRVLAVVVALLSVPAFAADYTPWAGHDVVAPSLLFRVKSSDDGCCKHCTKGQPCGDSCISASAKCKQPPGCAC